MNQGEADFVKLASELAYGKDSKPLQEGRVSLRHFPFPPPAAAEMKHEKRLLILKCA